jgi:hypothetical protein
MVRRVSEAARATQLARMAASAVAADKILVHFMALK